MRKIVFTEHHSVPEWENIEHKVSFLAYGEETAPTTGKKHFQGFAYARQAMRFSGWKKLFPTAHIEEMRGSFAQNEAYCSKESNLIKFGEPPMQGERKDLIGLKRKLDVSQTDNTNSRVMDIAMEDEYFGVVAKHSKFAKEYLRHRREKEVNVCRDMPRVYVLYGPPGAGKTSWLDRKFGTDGYARAPDNKGQWFDGCDRDVVLFDDVEAGQVPPFSLWKRLCDRYPFQVPVKGGFITWKPKVIVFTSNCAISEWWKELSPENVQARDRRIYKTLDLTSTDGNSEAEEDPNAQVQAEAEPEEQETEECNSEDCESSDYEECGDD